MSAKTDSELLVWTRAFEDFNEDRAALEKFEKKACEEVDKALAKLESEIRAKLKAEVDKSWDTYLDDFPFFSWEEGDFVKSIDEYIRDQIHEQSSK
jgi:hypothetical protein